MNWCSPNYPHLQLPPPINPFVAPAGKNREAKLEYCFRQIRILRRWIDQGRNLKFAFEIERWYNTIEAIHDNKI